MLIVLLRCMAEVIALVFALWHSIENSPISNAVLKGIRLFLNSSFKFDRIDYVDGYCWWVILDFCDVTITQAANTIIGKCIYRAAWTFCRSYILRISDFFCFAVTNFCGSRRLKTVLETNFCDFLFKQQNKGGKKRTIFNFCHWLSYSILSLLEWLFTEFIPVHFQRYFLTAPKDWHNNKIKQKAYPTPWHLPTAKHCFNTTVCDDRSSKLLFCWTKFSKFLRCFILRNFFCRNVISFRKTRRIRKNQNAKMIKIFMLHGQATNTNWPPLHKKLVTIWE